MNEQPADATVQHIADHQAITGLIYRYCRAMDRIDPELGYTIWHADGLADYGATFSGTGHGFVDWVCEQHRGMQAHSHQVTNIILTIDSDKAASESYVTAALRLERSGQRVEITVRGRYLDRWSRRDNCWGIDERRYIQDFDEIRPVGETLLPGQGRRDRDDPSYAVLGALGKPGLGGNEH